jgi:hypothetical protein
MSKWVELIFPNGVVVCATLPPDLSPEQESELVDSLILEETRKGLNPTTKEDEGDEGKTG